MCTGALAEFELGPWVMALLLVALAVRESRAAGHCVPPPPPPPRWSAGLYAANNRALRGTTIETKSVRSAVACGRECSMDARCRSVNFRPSDNRCEMKAATRREANTGAFKEDHGSVYFDGDEATPLFSVDDLSPQDVHYGGCQELFEANYTTSFIHTIYPVGFGGAGLQVYCDMDTDGGGWLVFQRRQDGSVDFNRNWAEYQWGFGDLSGEFWLGNDNLARLTSQGTWELRVDLGDWEGNASWAIFTSFKVSENDKYDLHIKDYDDAQSTACDSLTALHDGEHFSTKDHDDDESKDIHCAEREMSGWWFKKCATANLNGRHDANVNATDGGIMWDGWANGKPLKSCSMKMRLHN